MLLSNDHKSVVGGLPFGYWMKSASLGHKQHQRTIISSSHNMTTCAGGQLDGRNGGSNNNSIVRQIMETKLSVTE